MPKNDNNDKLVMKLSQRLLASERVHLLLDGAHVMAARYQAGAHFVPRFPIDGHAGVHLPEQMSAKQPRIAINQISPIIRQWAGRLRVDDWRATFNPDNPTSPDSAITSRIMRKWYDKWFPRSGLANYFDDTSYGRLVLGSQILTWYFDESAVGGIRLKVISPSRLSLDPSNPTQELEGHEYVIDSQALSIAEANRLFEPHLREMGVFPLKGGRKIADLRTTEAYLGRALYNLQPGGAEANTKGVVIHRMYDGWFKRLTIVVDNPEPEREKDDKVNKKDFSVEHDYHKVWDGEWDYGNPFLKLDCLKNLVSSRGDSMVLALVPPQDIINLVMRSKLRSFFARSSMKYFAMEDSIVNPEVLRSNTEGAVVQVKKTVRDQRMWPQPVQMGKNDMSVDGMIQQAESFMAIISSITPTLQGEAVTRGQSGQAYELLRQQGIIPIQNMAQQDKSRGDAFLTNLVRAGIIKQSRTNTKKLVFMVGPGIANKSMARNSGKFLSEEGANCCLRQSAFLAESIQEKQDRLFAALNSGRFENVDVFAREWFLQTGRQFLHGQDESYQNADEKVLRILLGEDVSIEPFDNHEAFIDRAKQVLSERLTRELDKRQLEDLQTAILASKDAMFNLAKLDGAMQSVASPGNSPVLPEESGAAGPVEPGLDGAAGGQAEQAAALSAAF